MSGRSTTTPRRCFETYRQIGERLGSLPGVDASGGVTRCRSARCLRGARSRVEGRTPPRGEDFINVDMRSSPAPYFQAMEIPLRAGPPVHRSRHARRRRASRSSMQHMAEQLWPGEIADRQARRPRRSRRHDAPWMTVVGVVGRVKQYTLDGDSRMAMYLSAHADPVARDERRRPQRAGDPASAGRGRAPGARAASIPTCRSTACGR